MEATLSFLSSSWWWSTTPGFICTTSTAIIAVLCFVTQEATNNYSQVDKLWSVLPALFAWVTALSDVSTRGTLETWSVRLTWNFSRRGGYAWPLWSGEEDYR